MLADKRSDGRCAQRCVGTEAAARWGVVLQDPVRFNSVLQSLLLVVLEQAEPGSVGEHLANLHKPLLLRQGLQRFGRLERSEDRVERRVDVAVRRERVGLHHPQLAPHHVVHTRPVQDLRHIPRALVARSSALELPEAEVGLGVEQQ